MYSLSSLPFAVFFPLLFFFFSSSSFHPRPTTAGPPDIVIAPSDTDVLLGNTVLFTCVVAFLNTPPELSWHRNDTGKLYNTSEISIYTSTIEESGVTFLRSILEVCGVELSDEGLYFCQAAYDMNPDRTARAYFYVDVLEPQGTCIQCSLVNTNLKKGHLIYKLGHFSRYTHGDGWVSCSAACVARVCSILVCVWVELGSRGGGRGRQEWCRDISPGTDSCHSSRHIPTVLLYPRAYIAV